MIVRRTMIAGSFGGLVWRMAPSRVQAAAQPEEIKLAVNSVSFVLASVKIGEQAGLFARDDLEPRIVVMDSGNAAMSALIGGSVQFAVAAPSEMLAARARGQDVVIVANLYAGMAASVVLSTSVARRLGVAATAPVKDRLRALNGLVVAVPSPTSAPLGPIKSAAEDAGAKVRFTYMAQGAMPAALETNAIQGMVAAFPFAGTPVLRGTGVLWIDGPGGELPADMRPTSSASVLTTRAFVRAKPQTVRKLQQAVIAIADFIGKDQTAAKGALAAAYPQLRPEEVDLAFKQQWRNWTKPFLTESDIRQELRLLIASTGMPGLEHLDTASAVVGPQ